MVLFIYKVHTYRKKYKISSLKIDFNYENPNKFKINILNPLEPLDDKLGENEPEEDKPELSLADVIMWVLSQNIVSNKLIMDKYQIGYEKANVYKKRLTDLRLISKTKQRKPVEVIPKDIYDLSDTVISLLKKYSFSEEKIQTAFGKRQNTPIKMK